MFELIPYKLRLTRPLHLAGGVLLTFREGLLLHDPETGGRGEAAPLPGFSRETLPEVLEAARRGEWEHPRLPSLRFAADCARRPVPRLSSPLPVNALWQPAAESVDQVLLRLQDWRNPVVKIKCVSDEDLAATRRLLARRADLRVRLDPNRQWSLKQTLRAFSRLPPDRLDYFEEPLVHPGGYEALWRQAPVPVALDESLLEPEGAELSRAPQVAALILKPTLLGGRDVLDRWDFHPRRVISSCFESGLGLWHLAALASLSDPAEPCGLDTARHFAEDTVHPRPLSVAGFLPPNPAGMTCISDCGEGD